MILYLLKNSLNGLLKIETSLESFIEFTRLKNNISNLGFKNNIVSTFLNFKKIKGQSF